MRTFLKSVQSSVSTRQEVHTLTNVSTTGISYTYCDRTDLSDRRSNYFISFNLPFESSAFPVIDASSSEPVLSQTNPELQQLNVDKIILGNIDGSYYNELLDGRSITFTCPQRNGLSLSAKTIISSTYGTLQKTSTDPLLGTNIAFLFCDEINIPYTGETYNASNVSIPINHANNLTWNTSGSYVNRPAAVKFSDVNNPTGINSNINSDTRTNANFAVTVDPGYPQINSGFNGYNYDIPVGFVALDKGFIVLTHPDIVDNFPFELGLKPNGSPNTGPTSATTNIHFTDTTKSAVRFVDINTIFKTSIFCLAMPREFYKSTNPSFDINKARQEETSGDNGFDSVYISELALHNSIGEVIAYAKLDAPLEKRYSDFLAFTVDLNI